MKILIFLLVALQVGCAGSTPKTTTYLLRAEIDSGVKHSIGAASVGIGKLVVAPYIERQGLVLETAKGEIHAARYHVWAEPLQLSLRQYLGVRIADLSRIQVDWQPVADPKWRRRLDIHIDQLHGSATGDVVLVAYWEIHDVDSNSFVSQHRFSDRLVQEHHGYAAMVITERVLIDRLAKSIADSLGE